MSAQKRETISPTGIQLSGRTLLSWQKMPPCALSTRRKVSMLNQNGNVLKNSRTVMTLDITHNITTKQTVKQIMENGWNFTIIWKKQKAKILQHNVKLRKSIFGQDLF